MHNTYGYIRGTTGVDGDHIDIFLSDTPGRGNVYVVDQYRPDGTFDEHKVMYGFRSKDEARKAYLSNYGKGWGNGRKLEITGVSKDAFKRWIDSSRRKTKPFAEYKDIVKEDAEPPRFGDSFEGVRFSLSELFDKDKITKPPTSGGGSGTHVPARSDAVVSISAVKLQNISEAIDKVQAYLTKINESEQSFGPNEFLMHLQNIFGIKKVDINSAKTKYIILPNDIEIRIADHYGNAVNFSRNNHPDDNFGIVIKMTKARFWDDPNSDYLELVFFDDKLTKERQMSILSDLKTFFEKDCNPDELPWPDWFHGSGGMEEFAKRGQAIIRAREDAGKEAARQEMSGQENADPNQIKSADENDGDFSTRNDDIRFSIAADDSISDVARDMAVEMVNDDKANWQERIDAMARLTGRLRTAARGAMVQRQYDRKSVNLVASMARKMMGAGLIDQASASEVSSLLGSMVHGLDRNDMYTATDRMLNIVATNQTRIYDGMMEKILKFGKGKQNAKGAEVLGRLDAEGQSMLRTFSEYYQQDGTAICARLSQLQSGTVADSVVNAELPGVMLAKSYHDTVGAARQEIADILNAMADLKKTWSKNMSSDERRGYSRKKKALSDSLTQARLNLADAVKEFTARIADEVSGSKERARSWREQERERKDDILHDANSDLVGVDTFPVRDPKRESGIENWGLTQFGINGMLGTFEQYMRLFGSRDSRGEGLLFERFMRGFHKCKDEEWTNVRAVEKEMDAQAAKILGRSRAKWSDLYKLSMKRAGFLTQKIGRNTRAFEVTQGNLMSIYAWSKMPDGRVKLEHQGLGETAMDDVLNRLDPRLKALADWAQERLLPKLRERYNQTHRDMFGVDMAAIENYFPLRILSDARNQEVAMDGQTRHWLIPRRHSAVTGRWAPKNF